MIYRRKDDFKRNRERIIGWLLVYLNAIKDFLPKDLCSSRVSLIRYKTRLSAVLELIQIESLKLSLLPMEHLQWLVFVRSLSAFDGLVFLQSSQQHSAFLQHEQSIGMPWTINGDAHTNNNRRTDRNDDFLKNFII